METLHSTIPGRVGADKMWELGFKGEGICIAFIDSGLQKDVSFEQQIVEAKDFSGFNSVRDDDNWHGNAMVKAALVVSPESNVGIFKVTDKFQTPSKVATINALKYCMEVFPKYRIVNLSLSFPPDNCPDKCELCKLVAEAYQKGILVTVAAGNKGHIEGENTITCPGRAYWALTSIGTLPQFQNEYLRNMGWLKKQIWDITGKMAKSYGTSFSSAYTAGCAALVFSALPKLTADTYRHFAITVQDSMRKEGQETLRVDYVYNELLRIRNLSKHAIITKPGALNTYVEEF